MAVEGAREAKLDAAEQYAAELDAASERQVPVTILTGFLGAGKTTLLNHILDDSSHGLRFAIIENEFGEVGVDDKILSEKCDEQVIEVMNGCICCTVRGDLVVALKKLHGKISQFDAVLIETTGLADPAPVAQTFFVDDDIQSKFVLDSIITVVDAKHITARLDDEKPEGVENESVEQVAFADRILLNKTDLVEEEELQAIEARLKALNPSAQVTRCQNSIVDPKSLLGINAFSLDRVLEMDPAFLDTEGEHEHDPSVSSCSSKFEGDLDLNTLLDYISGLMKSDGANLFRYKGILSVKGMDEKYVFQGVGMLYSGGWKSAWGPDEKRECRFVFIGKNLDKQKLVAGFEQCRVSGELRYPVGTKVTVWHEGTQDYVAGEVKKHWDSGNPYLIELAEKGSCGSCACEDSTYALADTEYWIRASQDASVKGA